MPFFAHIQLNHWVSLRKDSIRNLHIQDVFSPTWCTMFWHFLGPDSQMSSDYNLQTVSIACISIVYLTCITNTWIIDMHMINKSLLTAHLCSSPINMSTVRSSKCLQSIDLSNRWSIQSQYLMTDKVWDTFNSLAVQNSMQFSILACTYHQFKVSTIQPEKWLSLSWTKQRQCFFLHFIGSISTLKRKKNSKQIEEKSPIPQPYSENENKYIWERLHSRIYKHFACNNTPQTWDWLFLKAATFTVYYYQSFYCETLTIKKNKYNS